MLYLKFNTVLIFWSLVASIIAQDSPGINNACRNLDDYPTRAVNPNCYYNPDVIATVPEMLGRQNLPVRTVKFTTSDGYILTLFNVPPQDASNPKSPVFLQHGLLTNSECFCVSGNNSLAVRLAAQNYDVWLGNVRGTTYSRQHVTIPDTDPNFWNFTLDTLALVDLRESLKVVATETGKAGEIIVIGHSMGTTMTMMYSSAYPEEAASLVQGNVMLAPVVYMTGVNDVLFRSSTPATQAALDLLKIKVFFYNDQELHHLLPVVCGLTPDPCVAFLEEAEGHTENLPPEALLLTYGHIISATATNQLYHYNQILTTGVFKKFNYGPVGNLLRYGLPTPPLYNLRKVRKPTFFFYGLNDVLATQPNVERAFAQLGSRTKQLIQVPQGPNCSPYNHLDFLGAANIENCFYPDLFQIMTSNFV